MSWGTKRIAGVDYDLTHLNPFDLDVTPPYQGAPTHRVRVSFGFHTFTRTVLSTDTPDFHVWDGGQCRCFCLHRYPQSIHLPGFIKSAANGKAYFGNKNQNYLLIENLVGTNAPYVIVFKVDRGERKRDATMFIVSAHDRPGMSLNQPSIRLGTLIALTVQGKPIKRPKK